MVMATFIKAKAVRWVSDEPFPGLVAVEIVDAMGVRWTFVDKHPMFGRLPSVTPTARYPIDLLIACRVTRRSEDVVHVTTAEPWGLEATDGTFEFEVDVKDLVEKPEA